MEPAGAPTAVMRCDWDRVIMQMPKAVLKPTDKHLAHALALFGNPDGTSIHPGVPMLARVMCLDERTIMRSLKTLRELGFLIRVRHGTTKESADEYRLSVPANIAELLARPDTLLPNFKPKPKPSDQPSVRLNLLTGAVGDMDVTYDTPDEPVDNPPVDDVGVTYGRVAGAVRRWA